MKFLGAILLLEVAATDDDSTRLLQVRKGPTLVQAHNSNGPCAQYVPQERTRSQFADALEGFRSLPYVESFLSVNDAFLPDQTQNKIDSAHCIDVAIGQVETHISELEGEYQNDAVKGTLESMTAQARRVSTYLDEMNTYVVPMCTRESAQDCRNRLSEFLKYYTAELAEAISPNVLAEINKFFIEFRNLARSLPYVNVAPSRIGLLLFDLMADALLMAHGTRDLLQVSINLANSVCGWKLNLDPQKGVECFKPGNDKPRCLDPDLDQQLETSAEETWKFYKVLHTVVDRMGRHVYARNPRKELYSYEYRESANLGDLQQPYNWWIRPLYFEEKLKKVLGLPLFEDQTMDQVLNSIWPAQRSAYFSSPERNNASKDFASTFNALSEYNKPARSPFSQPGTWDVFEEELVRATGMFTPDPRKESPFDPDPAAADDEDEKHGRLQSFKNHGASRAVIQCTPFRFQPNEPYLESLIWPDMHTRDFSSTQIYSSHEIKVESSRGRCYELTTLPTHAQYTRSRPGTSLPSKTCLWGPEWFRDTGAARAELCENARFLMSVHNPCPLK